MVGYGYFLELPNLVICASMMLFSCKKKTTFIPFGFGFSLHRVNMSDFLQGLLMGPGRSFVILRS